MNRQNLTRQCSGTMMVLALLAALLVLVSVFLPAIQIDLGIVKTEESAFDYLKLLLPKGEEDLGDYDSFEDLFGALSGLMFEADELSRTLMQVCGGAAILTCIVLLFKIKKASSERESTEAVSSLRTCVNFGCFFLAAFFGVCIYLMLESLDWDVQPILEGMMEGHFYIFSMLVWPLLINIVLVIVASVTVRNWDHAMAADWRLSREARRTSSSAEERPRPAAAYQPPQSTPYPYQQTPTYQPPQSTPYPYQQTPTPPPAAPAPAPAPTPAKPAAAPAEPVRSAPVRSAKLEQETIELLKQYKELLDIGILTEEEFKAKKAILLDQAPAAEPATEPEPELEPEEEFSPPTEEAEPAAPQPEETGFVPPQPEPEVQTQYYYAPPQQDFQPHARPNREFDPDEPVMHDRVDEAFEAQKRRPEYGMKWYKFLIYFALFAGAIGNAISGILYLTGEVYQGKAELVYAVYPEMEGIGIFFGLCFVGLAVLQIVTRQSLYWNKHMGPKLLVTCYLLNTVLSIAFFAVLPNDVKTAMASSVIAPVIGSVVMVLVNVYYFRKREHLFVN